MQQRRIQKIIVLLHFEKKVLQTAGYAFGCRYLILDNANDVSVANDEATTYDWNRGGKASRAMLIGLERLTQGINDNQGFKTYYYGKKKIK